MDRKSAVRPSPGMWFEDFAPGRWYFSPTRTISESDVLTFGGITGDLYELHTSEAYAKTTIFGTRIAHGMLGLSVMHGLQTRTSHTLGTGIALIGWDRVRHMAPIFLGDTVQTFWRTTETRESRSRPDAGIVVEKLELYNQRDEKVLEGEVALLVSKKPR
ncbi:MAG: MaoC/PaaZ C-terminal domain-containing protein [Flavobacteriaceae bacterium]